VAGLIDFFLQFFSQDDERQKLWRMQWTATFKPGDIKGECAEDKHKEWINISDLKFGVNLPIIDLKSEGEANISDRGNFYDIYFGKGVDKTTPKLLEAVAKATLFEKVIIEMCQMLHSIIFIW
jgi:type VI secretion system secreted protein Hcp